MKRLIILLLMLISFLLTGCAELAELNPATLQPNKWYEVSGYVDGDTFKIKSGSETFTVRLLYVDTPETKKPNSPIELYGPEASDFAKELLSQSQEVKLAFDEEITDRYGRTLAIVELRDGRILNELLLMEGLAKVLIVEPNVKMENVYKQLEQDAKKAEIGIWSGGAAKNSSDFPVKEVKQSGIELEVDKRAELVTITNTSDQTYSLEGWKLISVKGNQSYPFGPYELKPGEQVTVSSAENFKATKSNQLHWGATNIWNNSQSDPGELYNDLSELVAVWED